MHKSVHLSVILSLVLFKVVDFVRVEDATLPTEELLAEKINAYGSDMLNGLYDRTHPEDNLLVSPVNTYATLALLYLGAGARTREELAVIMKLSGRDNYPSQLHDQLKAVISRLASKSEGITFHETVLANGIFVQNDITIKKSYLDLACKYYASAAKNVNFRYNPQESMNVINEWVLESTKGCIAKFYDEPISTRTIALLISALYFNAKWLVQFSPNSTKNETFKTGTTEIQTPMMNKRLPLIYETDHEILHYDSVSLPYSGNEYEMKIYLQHQEHGDPGSLVHLFHELSLRNFRSSNSSKVMVHLKLPKIRFSWKKSVVSALKLEEIFENPDLSTMTSLTNLTISDMTHATELEVDEQGTTATTATVVNIDTQSTHHDNESIKFYIDRPFLLFIKHKPTGIILFVGIISKPIP